MLMLKRFLKILKISTTKNSSLINSMRKQKRLHAASSLTTKQKIQDLALHRLYATRPTKYIQTTIVINSMRLSVNV